MADQQTTDAVVEGGKILGSGGAGMLLLGFIQRFFKKVEVDDEREAKALEGMLLEMKSLNTNVTKLDGKVDVLTERTTAMIARVDKAEVRIEALLDRIAKLEGQFEHLQEQLVK